MQQVEARVYDAPPSGSDRVVDQQLPSLWRDWSFWGMTTTQFLGAFNDNLYKQMVLLICLDYVMLRQLEKDPYQAIAQGMFALAFILFSGFAGWLSDRTTKRSIVVLSKVAEVGVMAGGLAVFATQDFGTDAYLTGLLAVLFLMGVQSAFFGPAKYGILPEMLRERDLPAANGIIQMTTFLAIIFGTAVCGFLKQNFEESGLGLWPISVVCIGLAVVGTGTSYLVRRTPVAHSGLTLRWRTLVVHQSTWRMIVGDRMLRGVLLATILFWFVGGVALPVVNAFGKEELRLGDATTSLLTACIGFGIAIGCVFAGFLSRHRVAFGLVHLGAWGMSLAFGALAASPWLDLEPVATGRIAACLLTLLGFSAGMYAVPLQVVLQARPPKDQKGRMIGAMNLFTWLGILLSAVTYGVSSWIFTTVHISRTFALLGLLVLPVALFYRPRDQQLGNGGLAD